MHTCTQPIAHVAIVRNDRHLCTSTQKVDFRKQLLHSFAHLHPFIYIMVAQAPSGKKPLPDMMTSIRLDASDKVEIVDQLLLP